MANTLNLFPKGAVGFIDLRGAVPGWDETVASESCEAEAAALGRACDIA